MRLKDLLKKLDLVSVEYRVCRLAADRLWLSIEQDPTLIIQLQMKRAEIRETIRRLEYTYIVRMFAAFEAALREIWTGAFRRKTEPPVRDLIDATAAANTFMTTDMLRAAHQVREYRNSIVHVNALSENTFSLLEAAAHLKEFLSFMPRQW